jgi:hypothetical protein
VPASASVRAVVGTPSMSTPPIFAFRSRNCANVILPGSVIGRFSAASPYWTPTLSIGLRAKPSFARRPHMFTWMSLTVARQPSRFVTGL